MNDKNNELYHISWTQAYDSWVKNEQLTTAEEMVETGLLLSDYAEAREVLARIMAL